MHLPNDLIERLEGYVEKLNRETPGVTFTRTDAVRVLLLRALERAEASDDPGSAAGGASGSAHGRTLGGAPGGTSGGTKRKI